MPGRVVVSVEDLSKRFRLYQEQYNSLKERAIHFGRIPYHEFWALRHINLEIREGETVGLLGHNGSGKSTLLKCVAGILQPTDGQVAVAGRIAALLELGAGFHPDLSGRENIFLNASLLGVSRREVERRFDDIVAFSELEQFIDNQVKYYSSGMYVRLGFAVAVNMDPDILLVDEVLAVGDENFQRKCLDRVKRFQKEGRTIIFVTHSPDLVRQICDWAAVLDEGVQVATGVPSEAVRTFREHLLTRQRYSEAHALEAHLVEEQPEEAAEGEPETAEPPKPKMRTEDLRITGVEFRYPQSETRAYLEAGDPLEIHIRFAAGRRLDGPVIWMGVHDLDGRLMWAINCENLGVPLGTVEGAGTLVFSYDSVPLLDGSYMVSVGAHSSTGGTVYDHHDQRYLFEVSNSTPAMGMVHCPGRASLTLDEPHHQGVAG